MKTDKSRHPVEGLFAATDKSRRPIEELIEAADKRSISVKIKKF